jgi:DNA-directed RNA polymerase specialized sigma24 family protein
VIYENDSDSIINQYIIFSKVYDEQRKKYGRTRQAITETIRICKDRNVLKEYLESREQEVVTIMMSLYDEEEIMKSYIKSERYEERQIATQEKAEKTAISMIKKQKYSLEDIAEVTDLPLEEVKKLEQEIMQLS